MDVVEVTPEALLGPLNDAEAMHAPARLYAMGELALFARGARVLIAGARLASPTGARRTRRLVDWLCGRGVVILSGLSGAIETAAHLAAVEAGGRTVAVLGTPIDRAYPPENAALQRQLAREQLVLSQFPIGTTIRPAHHVERNRTMALLSDATIIMEAGDDSLSLDQGWESLRLKRPLFIARSLTLNAELTWPAAMLGQGAHVLANETLDELYAMLPVRGDGAPRVVPDSR